MNTTIAIFASGEGTNAENIICYFKNSPSKIGLIVTNNPSAGVIKRAKNHTIPIEIITKSDLNLSDVLIPLLSNYAIDFIVLSGFLLKIPDYLVDNYPNRIVNIHPALLPKYGGKGMYGMNVHRAVLAANEKESGITIHYVNKEYDKGMVIFQAKCPVELTETPESLAVKIHDLEYRWFPEVVKRFVLLPDVQ